MKVYCVAVTEGKYMFPKSKPYVQRKSAEKKANQLNEEHGVSNHVVLVADNWSKPEQESSQDN